MDPANSVIQLNASLALTVDAVASKVIEEPDI